jgi:endonuclease-3
MSMISQSIEAVKSIEERVRQILGLLKKAYGFPRWRLRQDSIGVLVQTILSQNTSDTNSRSAFRSLLATFGSWEEVAGTDVDTIARSIKGGGLGRVKAERIKQALKGIVRRRGQFELDFLKELGLSEAEDWLLSLPGVGEKTARCVLLFSLGMPALPVDTHIWRVTKRLGLTPPEASLHEAHRILGAAVPEETVYQFHVLVIEHGRKTCRARNPDCPRCVLKDICPSYPVFFPPKPLE